MEETQTMKCEATGQIIAKRYSRRTEDGHYVSVEVYNKVALERMNFILTLKDITDTLQELEEYYTSIRKFILWVLKDDNVQGDSVTAKMTRLIQLQSEQSIQHFKKFLPTITRKEHLQLISSTPYQSMKWNQEAVSQSLLLDNYYNYLTYFTINKKQV